MRLVTSIFKTVWKLGKNLFFYLIAFLCGSFEVALFLIRQKFFGNTLPNYFVVEEDSLHRGGQPSPCGLKALAKKGIKTVINLRLSLFSKNAIEEYSKDEIRMISLPFSPFEPEDHVMIEFLKILVNPNHKPAFVHCFHGADRTGAVCAMYRIVIQGWDKEKAIWEMKKRGLHFWHTNMIDYIKKLDVDWMRKHIELI